MSSMQKERRYGDGVAQTEQEQLVAWRAECLYDAGLRDIHVARRLSMSDCDLHKACEMISQGADPKLVAKILL